MLKILLWWRNPWYWKLKLKTENPWYWNWKLKIWPCRMQNIKSLWCWKIYFIKLMIDDDLVECHVSSEEHTVITYIQVDAGSIEVWKKINCGDLYLYVNIIMIIIKHCLSSVHFKCSDKEYHIQFDLQISISVAFSKSFAWSVLKSREANWGWFAAEFDFSEILGSRKLAEFLAFRCICRHCKNLLF